MLKGQGGGRKSEEEGQREISHSEGEKKQGEVAKNRKKKNKMGFVF